MSEFDMHSLFGSLQGQKTKQALNQSSTERSFVLSRSTFAGSGATAAHWMGENTRNWDEMKYSIAGVMNFNMFGIPMTGPTTCGYYKDESIGAVEQRQLCARWI